MAEAGVFGQHGQEGIDHARAKTFAEHDAVDVARIEMFRRGLDAERADHAGLLAERDRQRGIGAAAADQQHGGVPGGVDIRQRDPGGRYQPAHHGRMQRADTQRRAQARDEAAGIALALEKRNGVIGQAFACGSTAISGR